MELIEPFDGAENSRLAGKVVEKMLRNKVIGGHKKQIDTIANWFATDEQGDVKEIIDIMIADRNCPVEMYGGRPVVRLTDYERAKEFSEKRDGDVEWL